MRLVVPTSVVQQDVANKKHLCCFTGSLALSAVLLQKIFVAPLGVRSSRSRGIITRSRPTLSARSDEEEEEEKKEIIE